MLKRRISILLLLILLFAVCSCGDRHISHLDANGDGYCDECGAELEISTECQIHKDIDGNLLCDECGVEIPEEKCDCVDSDGNAVCDKCKEIMSGYIAFVKKGQSDYKFIIQNDIGSENVKAIDGLIDRLAKCGVRVERHNDGDVEESEYEVLFGEITSRGEKYVLPVHDYGEKGYSIRIVGNKILVGAGSKEALLEAIRALETDFFGITADTKRITRMYIETDRIVESIQTDYPIERITLNGQDMRGYCIAADMGDKNIADIAKKIQQTFYHYAGYWLPIIEPTESERVISLSLVDKSGGPGFYADFSRERIDIVSEYCTSLDSETERIFGVLTESEGEVAFVSEQSYEKDVRCVYYKDFGTVGDGVTDDSEAIRAAHNYANKGGHEWVYGEAGKTYYIGALSSSIKIMTNVDFMGAEFIIDDTVTEVAEKYRNVYIFNVKDDTHFISGSPKITQIISEINGAGGLKAADTVKLDLGIGHPAMISLTNTDRVQYIRYGVNSNDGLIQSEVVSVDKDGNIDPETPLMFDFDGVTNIKYLRTDTPSITVRGGSFTTIANNVTGGYFARGIIVYRPNTVIENISHYIVGEGDVGTAYETFLAAVDTYNILVKDSKFSGHRTYYNSQGVGKGSYDINANRSIRVTWKNCVQVNFYNENGSIRKDTWGIMGSNFSKCLTFDSCLLTRFDAHCGVYNASMINSTMTNISVTGAGKLLVEGCTVYSDYLIRIREDYGSFWGGDVIIKDTVLNSSRSTVNLFNITWYNHYFGYDTALPKTLVIDGFTTSKATSVNLLPTSFVSISDKIFLDEIVDSSGKATENKNKMKPIERIVIRNNTSGLNFIYPEGAYFADTEIIIE